MASRTNKQGIAKKKAQQAKQASRVRGARRFDYPKRKLELEEAKELWIVGVYTNPKGATYNRFLRGRKVGYRYIRTPAGASEIVLAPSSGWIRTKMKKMVRRR